MIAWRTAIVEVEAAICLSSCQPTNFDMNLLEVNYLSANNVGKAGLVVVCSGRNNIPLLPSATIAGLDLNRDQILPEIA